MDTVNGESGSRWANAEERRLAVLQEYRAPTEAPDAVLDSLVRVASRALEAPMAVVALVDRERVHFVARHGVDTLGCARETSAAEAILRSGGELVVTDATEDPLLSTCRMVVDAPHVRFVAGVPLVAPEGEMIGCMLAMGPQIRGVREEQLEQLRSLARVAMQQLVALRQEAGLRRAEAALLDHERYFQDSVDLNAILSRDGRFLHLNPRWTGTVGWDLGQLRARQYLEFVHPDDRDATRAALERLAHGDDLTQFRLRFRHADGRDVWLEWIAYAPSRSDGRTFARARDITAAVEAERSLRRQNQMLSLIGESQARLFSDGPGRGWWDFVLGRLLALTASRYGFIGVTGRDAQGRFVRMTAVSGAAQDAGEAPSGLVLRELGSLYGRAVEQDASVICNDVAHEAHGDRPPQGLPPLDTFAGLPLRDRAELVGLVGLADRPGGYDAALLASLDPVLAYLGAVLKRLSLDEERERFVRELEAAKRLQERLLESLNSGFVALGADGSVAFANRAARALSPKLAALQSRPEPLGLDLALARLFPLENDPQNLRRLVEVAPGTHTEPLQVRSRDENGTPVPVEVVASRVTSAEDVPTELLLSMVDLRPRLALEESLQRAAQLDEQVTHLRRHREENEILAKCIELLLASVTLAEGYEVVMHAMARIFPGANVALYAGTQPGAPLRLVQSLRRHGPSAPADEISARQCWALRSHRSHGSWDGGHEVPCSHSSDVPGKAEFCAPLAVSSRESALLTVKFSGADKQPASQELETRLSQFDALAQGLSGALSSIALRESLERLALTDELTELPNRRAFMLEVGRELARARRNGDPFALCILDIDHFKLVNDTLGHEGGDELLRRIATLMRRYLREGDLCARVGGEEFAIFLGRIAPPTAVERMEGLLQVVRSTCSVRERPVTLSVGVAHSSDAPEEHGFEQFYRRADLALYEAKAGGRDRVVRARREEPSLFEVEPPTGASRAQGTATR